MKDWYKEALLDPRWDQKRKIILKRDNYKCTDCGATNVKLHVHHIKYKEYGTMPWDYDNDQLTSLCDKCHKKVHNIKINNIFEDETQDVCDIKIYLAGKVVNQWWREKFLNILFNENYYNDYYNNESKSVHWKNYNIKIWDLKDAVPFIINKKYTYVGPFSLGCDHGCAHNIPLSHGMSSCNQSSNEMVCIYNYDIKIPYNEEYYDKTCVKIFYEDEYGYFKSIYTSTPRQSVKLIYECLDINNVEYITDEDKNIIIEDFNGFDIVDLSNYTAWSEFPNDTAFLQAKNDTVLHNSLSQIKACDIMIVNFDANIEESYGTIAEIGYAFANNKIIYGVGNRNKDLWFVQSMCKMFNDIDELRIYLKNNILKYDDFNNYIKPYSYYSEFSSKEEEEENDKEAYKYYHEAMYKEEYIEGNEFDN